MLKHSYSQIIIFTFLVLLSYGNSVYADIQIQLAEPQWAFILQNQSLALTEARLQPNERGFAKKIQPLLTEQNYAEVIKAFNERPLENDSAALQLLRGQVLLSIKKYSDAEAALNAALESMPNLALAHRSLSMVYMQQKSYIKARRHLTKTIELGVADAQVYGQLAFVNLQMSAASSAVAGYQQALFLEPDNKQWQQGLLYALMDSQALNQAQALVEQMLNTDINKAELWLLRGQIAIQQQRHSQALSSLEIALRLGEKSPENQAMAAQLHLEHGSVARAVDLLADSLKFLNKNNTESVLTGLDKVIAWLAYQQDWQSTNQLLSALNKVRNKIPESYQARFNIYRAQYALQNGQVKKAQQWLSQAIKVDPGLGEALLTLADLHRGKNNLDQAVMYYVRAEAMSEYKERALLGRAQLEINRQSYREALQLLRQVIRLNPGRSDIAANIRSLQHLVRHEG